MTQPAVPNEPAQENDQEALWGEPDAGSDPVAAASADVGSPPDAEPMLVPRRPQPGRSVAWSRSLARDPAVSGPAGLSLAEMPDRIIAFILDVIVLAIVGVLLAVVVGSAFGGLATGGATVGGSLDDAAGDLNVGAFFVVGLLALAISFGYFAWSWVMLRSTPGMRMLGLRIGDQADGRAISWDQALIRWLILGIAATLVTFVVYVPSLVGLGLALLGLLWLAVLLYATMRSPTRQGLQDRYARTVIVRMTRRS